MYCQPPPVPQMMSVVLEPSMSAKRIRGAKPGAAGVPRAMVRRVQPSPARLNHTSTSRKRTCTRSLAPSMFTSLRKTLSSSGDSSIGGLDISMYRPAPSPRAQLREPVPQTPSPRPGQ
ncbi:MAG: hypothetical protein SangKO_092500 [Sandaracinaceae bacterium]